MASLQIHIEGDGCWKDLEAKRDQIIHVTDGMEIAALSGGMESGRPSISLRIDLPDGRVVIAELSMRLFLTAARAFAARYGQEAQ